MGERTEALMGIIVGIITGIIIYIFAYVVQLVTFFHWFYVIISGKRSKSIAEFCNSYCTMLYKYTRYLTFTTNERPIPFGNNDEVEPINVPRKR